MTAIAIPARRRHVLASLKLTGERIDATLFGDSRDPARSDRDTRHEFASANYDARVTGKRQPEQESEGRASDAQAAGAHAGGRASACVRAQ